MDTQKILERNAAAPRYTSYPPATEFRTDKDSKRFLDCIAHSNHVGASNISLYFHVPFCPHRCLFCGCNTEIGRPASFVEDYFDSLHAEMDMVLPLLDSARRLTQVHFGGGTPNAVPEHYLVHILDSVRSRFLIGPDAEVAIECDPALLSLERLRGLRTAGFNRISFGIQDFNEDVLALVERKGSRRPVPELVGEARRLGFRGINLDLIYGLPGQTREKFRETLRRTVESRPDRIALFSYAHVPWVKDHQKTLEVRGLPDAATKLDMFLEARDVLGEAGWQWIGMDHFALPDDALSLAAASGALHRNFQGYCTRETTGQVYAFGASGITQLEDAYGQSIKDSQAYVAALARGEYPLEKTLYVKESERRVGRAIEQLMCNGWIEAESPAADVADGLNRLAVLIPDGLVVRDGPLLRATEEGRLVIRHLAKQLDPLLVGGAPTEGVFSKTV